MRLSSHRQKPSPFTFQHVHLTACHPRSTDNCRSWAIREDNYVLESQTVSPLLRPSKSRLKTDVGKRLLQHATFLRSRRANALLALVSSISRGARDVRNGIDKWHSQPTVARKYRRNVSSAVRQEKTFREQRATRAGERHIGLERRDTSSINTSRFPAADC